jgi:phosphate-selective porin OprO and OprP
VKRAACAVLLAAALLGAQAAAAAEPDPQDVDDTLNASEGDDAAPPRAKPAWNGFDFKILTLRLGGGFLYDFAAYDQDGASADQVTLKNGAALRDFRFVLKGRFKPWPRLSYTIGYMYDGPTGQWRWRQTGLMIDVPELYGSFFIGRAKEGFSTNKLMNGYSLWTNERTVANEAFLPILADGIKWDGAIPSHKLVYNLGWFTDLLGTRAPFLKNEMQVAGRAVYLPFGDRPDLPLVHFAVEGRWGKALDGQLQFRSRPESVPGADYFVDTGKFPAQYNVIGGLELYFRLRQFTAGSEYFFNQVAAPSAGNPFFHGGEAFAAFLLTGETRGYNVKGGFFEPVSPARTITEGGPGAFELVVRGSYVDLDSGNIEGGRFWRVTPMINWYLTDFVRIELVYGYGRLARTELSGGTQFFQARLQLQLF